MMDHVGWRGGDFCVLCMRRIVYDRMGDCVWSFVFFFQEEGGLGDWLKFGGFGDV